MSASLDGFLIFYGILQFLTIFQYFGHLFKLAQCAKDHDRWITKSENNEKSTLCTDQRSLAALDSLKWNWFLIQVQQVSSRPVLCLPDWYHPSHDRGRPGSSKVGRRGPSTAAQDVRICLSPLTIKPRYGPIYPSFVLRHFHMTSLKYTHKRFLINYSMVGI